MRFKHLAKRIHERRGVDGAQLIVDVVFQVSVQDGRVKQEVTPRQIEQRRFVQRGLLEVFIRRPEATFAGEQFFSQLLWCEGKRLEKACDFFLSIRQLQRRKPLSIDE